MSKLEVILAAKRRRPDDAFLRHMVNTQFYFDKDYSWCLSRYYVLQWTPHHFISTLNNGIIEREGTEYDVIYFNTTVRAIAREGLTNKQSHVKLSFRVPLASFHCEPTVLVKLYTNTLK